MQRYELAMPECGALWAVEWLEERRQLVVRRVSFLLRWEPADAPTVAPPRTVPYFLGHTAAGVGFARDAFSGLFADVATLDPTLPLPLDLVEVRLCLF